MFFEVGQLFQMFTSTFRLLFQMLVYSILLANFFNFSACLTFFIKSFFLSWASQQSFHISPAGNHWCTSTSANIDCISACVCCASSTILPQLWPCSSVGGRARCVCVLRSPTGRPGLTEQIAWLLKRCWGLWCSPPSPSPQWISADAQVQ